MTEDSILVKLAVSIATTAGLPSGGAAEDSLRRGRSEVARTWRCSDAGATCLALRALLPFLFTRKQVIRELSSAKGNPTV